MKTTTEIVEKIKQESGCFSFVPEVLMEYLPHTEARPFLNEEWKEKSTEWTQKPQDREAIIADMRDYMEFAWGKAIDHRGLSAGRSISKMQAWLWLLGDEEMYAFTEADRNYPNYGAPILKAISEKYGFPVPDDEDARAMAEGRKCPSCARGNSSGCCN